MLVERKAVVLDSDEGDGDGDDDAMPNHPIVVSGRGESAQRHER